MISLHILKTLAVKGAEHLCSFFGFGSPPEPWLFIRGEAEASFRKMG
jgi:hypothetical protein